MVFIGNGGVCSLALSTRKTTASHRSPKALGAKTVSPAFKNGISLINQYGREQSKPAGAFSALNFTLAKLNVSLSLSPPPHIECITAYFFSGAGYSTPNVSTVMFLMRCSSTGRSPRSVSQVAISSRTSSPETSLPNAA